MNQSEDGGTRVGITVHDRARNKMRDKNAHCICMHLNKTRFFNTSNTLQKSLHCATIFQRNHAHWWKKKKKNKTCIDDSGKRRRRERRKKEKNVTLKI